MEDSYETGYRNGENPYDFGSVEYWNCQNGIQDAQAQKDYYESYYED